MHLFEESGDNADEVRKQNRHGHGGERPYDNTATHELIAGT
jgi:hypothetical protein